MKKLLKLSVLLYLTGYAVGGIASSSKRPPKSGKVCCYAFNHWDSSLWVHYKNGPQSRKNCQGEKFKDGICRLADPDADTETSCNKNTNNFKGGYKYNLKRNCP